MSTTSLILDIETLSRRPDAIVTEIAALAIKGVSKELIGSCVAEIDSIIINTCIASQLAGGRHFDAETLSFHERQGTLPANFVGTTPLNACVRLSHFISQHKPATVWIWGKDFDRPILESFYAQHHIPFPWEFWRTACARDAWKLAFGDIKPAKRNHRALDDCRATLQDLSIALSHLDCMERL